MARWPIITELTLEGPAARTRPSAPSSSTGSTRRLGLRGAARSHAACSLRDVSSFACLPDGSLDRHGAGLLRGDATGRARLSRSIRVSRISSRISARAAGSTISARRASRICSGPALRDAERRSPMAMGRSGRFRSAPSEGAGFVNGPMRSGRACRSCAVVLRLGRRPRLARPGWHRSRRPATIRADARPASRPCDSGARQSDDVRAATVPVFQPQPAALAALSATGEGQRSIPSSTCSTEAVSVSSRDRDKRLMKTD